MAATPPPAALREPRAPRHGAGYDSFDPYPTRHSERLARQRSVDAHTTPPPSSPKKGSRQIDINTLSPPRTLTPRKKPIRGKAPLFIERLDLDSSDLSDSATTSAQRQSHAAIVSSHSSLLPTPAKTPRHKKSHANFGSTARSLFPGDLSSSSRSKNTKKPSGFSLESFHEDSAGNNSSIAIYTDCRDRIPVANESLDNPFVSKSEAKMPSDNEALELKRRERTSRVVSTDIDPKEAVKRSDGLLYTFRGKKVFRRFEDKRSEDDAEDDAEDDLGFFAIRPDLLDSSVNLHVPRMTRSAIKGRRLFCATPENEQPAEETLVEPVDENEEAATDIEETQEATEGTDILHSEGDLETSTKRSLRVRPARMLDGKIEPTHAAVAETKKKREKRGSPFDIWARKKQQSPPEVSTSKKRDADPSTSDGPASKKTRGH